MSATASSFDRLAGDVGNVTSLEHVNVTVPDLHTATIFYVNAMGFTRDPYLDLGPDLVWFNLGRQQFHVPLGDPQAVRGTIDIATPSLSSLERRLSTISERLNATAFDFDVGHDVIDVRGPWGNHFRCREPHAGALTQLGMTSVELMVPAGAAAPIGRFYDLVLGAPVTVADGRCAVDVGPGQSLRFVETDDAIEPYDGHHIAVYVADFSGPHRWLAERDLIVEETSEHQYRFNWIADVETGDRLFEIEHEVRSLRHPLYRRRLVNRNPDQNPMAYVPGADDYHPNGARDGSSFADMRDALSTVG